MVVVDSVPKVERHVAEVSIVRVLLKINDVTGANRSDDLLRNGRLARSRTPADTDYHSVIVPSGHIGPIGQGAYPIWGSNEFEMMLASDEVGQRRCLFVT